MKKKALLTNTTIRDDLCKNTYPYSNKKLLQNLNILQQPLYLSVFLKLPLFTS